MPRRFHLLACLPFLASLGLSAGTNLTVHNETGQTLAISRLWSPWRPEADEGSVRLPFFHRWIRPGKVVTYRFDRPGKDLDAEIVIRRLPEGGVIDFEHLRIQAVDPCDAEHGEEPQPEPEAQAILGEL